MMMNCQQYWVNKLSFNIPPVFLVVLPSFSLPLLSQIIKSTGLFKQPRIAQVTNCVSAKSIFFLELSPKQLRKSTQNHFGKKNVFSKFFKLTGKSFSRKNNVYLLHKEK